jgi:hypothetical protein
MDKIYCYYNTAGISGRDVNNVDHYIKCIESIRNQILFDCSFRIIVSACRNNSIVLDKLDRHFNSKGERDVEIFDIRDHLPVNVTFNYSVLQSVKRFGPASAYLYIDSGVNFTKCNQLIDLWTVMNSGPYSIVSSLTDDDSGADQWFNNSLPGGDSFVMPIGKALNLHVALFSESWRSYYNKVLPDIFAGHCSESVLSFIAAAIATQWVVAKKVVVSHKRDVDGQSSGYDPAKWVQSGKSRFDHPFVIPSVFERVIPGRPLGLGYEGEMCPHDATQFDENGFCKHEFLKEYIKENLFLRQSEFDYNRINGKLL